MIDLLNVYGICMSSIAFSLLNKNVINYYKPKLIGDDHQYIIWKWKNTCTSFVHSAIVGFGVLFTVIVDRALTSNLIHAYSDLGNAFMCIASGYFIYDMILSLTHLQYPGRIEIIIHHFISVSCLLVSLSKHKFLGYCVVGLTVEVNNVFIHIRQILLLVGKSAKSKYYRINSIVTVLSVFIFRFVPLSWISYHIFLDKEYLTVPLLVMGVLCLTTIIIVSCVLLFIVITADFKFINTRCLVHFIAYTTNKFHYECSSKLRKML